MHFKTTFITFWRIINDVQISRHIIHIVEFLSSKNIIITDTILAKLENVRVSERVVY